MGNFSRFVLAVFVSGIVAGLLVTSVHRWQITPMLETAAATTPGEARANESSTPAATKTPRQTRHFGGALVLNTVAGLAAACLLVSLISLHGGASWLTGLLWGLAGFLAFFLYPSLGMPPKLPASLAGSFGDQSGWWWLAASCASVSMALVLLQPRWLFRIVGLLLLAVPFVAGLPDAGPQTAWPVPDALALRFYWSLALASLLFWLALGVLAAGLFGQRNRYDDFL
jgi:predicted cobalt transporter CbtA